MGTFRTTAFAPSSKPRLLLGVFVAAVIAAGCGVAGDESGQPPADLVGGQVQAAPKTLAPVRDGKFEFTVQDVKCGVAEVGEDFMAEQAQGQFCLVTVQVKNIGDQPQTFSDMEQKGFDAGGKEYGTDSMAGIAANENNELFLDGINPGNEVEVVLVFDIPTPSSSARAS
jgi:hypothetical protein